MNKHFAAAVLTVCLSITTAVCAHAQPARLSPRPVSVEGVSNCSLPLNGTWKFQTAAVPPTDIDVPGEWTMQGFDVPEGQTAVYTRTFSVPADWQNKRVKIRFDGVSSYGRVTVNGQPVGEHEGGMVPFEFDITRTLKSGNNELRVEVKALTVSDRLGCISQYAVHTVGGLTRKVTLHALPEINIASTEVNTLLDKAYKSATLHIRTAIAAETGTSAESATVLYTLKDATGKPVASAKATHGADRVAQGKITVANARLWNPEQPYLYTLHTTLTVNGKTMQTNQQRIGLRQVEVKGNILTINGKKVKLHGVNRHETHPLRGRSLTPELCRLDAEIFRAGNCNYIRTSHYPPSEEFLDACDELGLFVECEAALTWIQHHASPIWKNWKYEDPQYLPYMLRANLENVAANRRHPSVIIWSLGNESRWSGLWDQVRMAVKEADPSRPTSFHDQCWGGFNNAHNKADIANYHYPGIGGPAACDTMSRPVLFGEYAHLSCYNRVELATDPGVRAAFGKPLQQMYDSIYHHDACLGGALWSGIDDVFHLADGRILGYGPWGPVDGWRRPKPEYTGMKKAFTPFRLLHYDWTRNEKTGTFQITLDVENRYDFINLSQVKIEYGSIHGNLSELKANLPPRSKGKITLTVKADQLPGVYLKVTDPRGFVCAEEILAPEEADQTPIGPSIASALKVEDTPEALLIHNTNPSGTQTYTLAKVTGLITQATSAGKVVLRQGPAFSLVAMNSDDGGKPNVAGETYHSHVYPKKDYPLYTLYARSFNHKQESDGSVTVRIEADYFGGHKGEITYRFTNDNRVAVNYEIQPSFSKETSIRQYGLLMQVPQSMSTLTWQRKGEFSVYPENDIARIKGVARLNAAPLYETEQWRVVPKGDWKEDTGIFGSVDFRSTKTQIRYASLKDNDGNGLIIHGNGTQALRAWLQDGCIQVLTADYNNAGSEPFYGSPFTAGRLQIKTGNALKGNLIFELK